MNLLQSVIDWVVRHTVNCKKRIGPAPPHAFKLLLPQQLYLVCIVDFMESRKALIVEAYEE